MKTEECPKCGGVIYLDQAIEWVKEKKVFVFALTAEKGKD